MEFALITDVSRYVASHGHEPDERERGTWIWSTNPDDPMRASEAVHGRMTFADSVRCLDRGITWYLLP